MKRREGNIHNIVSTNLWHDIVEYSNPDLGFGYASEPYLYLRCNRQTAVGLCWDPDAKMLVLRVEGTLQSNFVPAYKLMSETIESCDGLEGKGCHAALVRGIAEELGWHFASEQEADASIYFLGTLAGTYNEMHNFYCAAVVLPGYYEFWSRGRGVDFEGDGSAGENNSGVVCIQLDDVKLISDWLFWYVFGRHYAELNTSQQYCDFWNFGMR